MKKTVKLLLSIAIIVAIVLSISGCNNSQKTQSETPKTTNSSLQSERNVLGEGQTEFIFTVTDKDGNETEFEIHTDKKIVGEALLELNLIEGEDGPYGLYVKTVNEITVDYDTDGKYWSFYVNGEYANSGVDTTEITEGATYSFKVE